jgi:hypothetical protein
MTSKSPSGHPNLPQHFTSNKNAKNLLHSNPNHSKPFSVMPNLKPILEFDGNNDNEPTIDTNIVNNNRGLDVLDGNLSSASKKKLESRKQHEHVNINRNKTSRSNELTNGFSNSEFDSKCSVNNQNMPFEASKAVVEKQGPAFLLIESLVWKICCLHEKDINKQRLMYDSICQVLSARKIIGKTYNLDALQPIRDRIVIRLNQMIEMVQQTGSLVPCSDNGIPYLPCSTDVDVNGDSKLINNNHPLKSSSFYQDEFIQIGLIEKGGKF